jgi:hypothetical protein
MIDEVLIFRELSYFGSKKDKIVADLNQRFGPLNWDMQWWDGSKAVDFGEAINLYEDAYFEYLKKNKDLLEWLINTASEVYDISESNLESGEHYAIQECKANHYQDIAVRRVLSRIGEKFKGNRLVQIRGKNSEGYRLNPGIVPFHQPDIIVQTPIKSWWNEGSIEQFYQNNKVLVVNRENFKIESILTIGNRVIYQNGQDNYYTPRRGHNPGCFDKVYPQEIEELLKQE